MILQAQRCAAFLAILYNLDNSRVFADDANIEEVQAFVLETLYSIAYEVQELIISLGQGLEASFQKPIHYGRVLCALYLLYRSINSHCEFPLKGAKIKALVCAIINNGLSTLLTQDRMNFSRSSA